MNTLFDEDINIDLWELAEAKDSELIDIKFFEKGTSYKTVQNWANERARDQKAVFVKSMKPGLYYKQYFSKWEENVDLWLIVYKHKGGK